MVDPIEQFNTWWKDALSDSPLKQRSAVCVSTIDADGFPNARFVDLKSVDQDGFVFCSYYDSAKGNDIAGNPKTAITIWWDHVGYQIRVAGMASKISEQQADLHWAGRSPEAQLTTLVSEQSKILDSEQSLHTAVTTARAKFDSDPIPRPENWGGYVVAPQTIEFLTFREDRLHRREQFEQHAQGWKIQLLQP